MTHINNFNVENKTYFPGYPGVHDNPWLCDCQISMLVSLSMSLGSPVVLMDQLVMCSRSLGHSGMLLTETQLSRCMRPSVQPAATRVISPLGSNVILRCDATGYPTPTLTWIKTSASAGEDSRVPLRLFIDVMNILSLSWVILLSSFPDCCLQNIIDSTEQLPRNLESCKLYFFVLFLYYRNCMKHMTKVVIHSIIVLCTDAVIVKINDSLKHPHRPPYFEYHCFKQYSTVQSVNAMCQEKVQKTR